MTDLTDTSVQVSREASRQREGPKRLTEDLREILSALRDQGPGRLRIAMVLVVVGGFTEGISILMLLPILHVLLEGQGAAEEMGHLEMLAVQAGLPVLLAGMVGLVLAQVVFARVKATYLNDLLFDFTNAVRLSLFRALARARWDRIMCIPGSELEHALTSEAERISTCAYFILAIAQAVLMLAVYSALCIWVSPLMTIVILTAGVTILILMAPFRRRAARYGELLQSARQRQFATVSDFLAGLKIARATNKEDRFYNEFKTHLLDAKQDTTAFVRDNAVGTGIFQVLVTLGAALFIYVAVDVIQLPFASLVVMLLIAMRIAPRFMALQMQIQQLLPDLAAWRQMQRLEGNLRQAEDASARETQEIARLKTGVRLERVSYRYEKAASPALDGLSLDIRAGQVTALIGTSGSGKSTVADIVTGLLHPADGMVRFDGRPLSPSELRGWRDQVAYVAQDNFLLNRTVAENLQLMVSSPVSDAEMWRALEQAAASEFVRALPDGLHTVIGRRGIQLSGGQRQRLALAQAFIRSPALLVLDEATSALDWKTQDQVAQAVKALTRQGMTVLTIAHRPSMVLFADHVYALQGGKVVEEGPLDALRSRPGGLLANMLRHEQGDIAQESSMPSGQPATENGSGAVLVQRRIDGTTNGLVVRSRRFRRRGLFLSNHGGDHNQVANLRKDQGE